jgi:hypothetical protein
MTVEAVGIVLGVLGIVVSAAGFAITLLQLHRTRTAVDAAQDATKAALTGLAGRITIAEIADIRSGMRSIQTALRGARFETALIHTQLMLEQLSGLRTRQGFRDEEKHIQIQTIVTELAKLRNRLEQRINDPLVAISIPKANNMLSQHGQTLSVWTEELRFVTEKEES